PLPGQAQAPEWQRDDTAAESYPDAAAAGTGEFDLATEMDAIFAAELDDQPAAETAPDDFEATGASVQDEWRDAAEAAPAYEPWDASAPEADPAANEDAHPFDDDLPPAGDAAEIAAAHAG